MRRNRIDLPQSFVQRFDAVSLEVCFDRLAKIPSRLGDRGRIRATLPSRTSASHRQRWPADLAGAAGQRSGEQPADKGRRCILDSVRPDQSGGAGLAADSAAVGLAVPMSIPL